MALAPARRARLQATAAFAGSLLLHWRLRGPASLGLAVVLGALAALAWISPAAYAPVQRAFDRVTHALLVALTWLVLGLVYFGLFVPMRLGRALLRRDPLQLRRDPAAVSFLHPLAPRSADHFERPF